MGLHAMTAAIGKLLVLGGVRSGKSRHAEELARGQARAVTLIATAEARDEEMATRIEAHRRRRDARWRVIEEPVALAAALRAAGSPESLVIVDCLTVWLSNLLCGEDADAARRETQALLDALGSLGGDCILISNEVGFGIIPANALARRFGDEAGVLHQRIATLCDRVVLMVAGLPLTVKDSQPRMPPPGVSP
jgi:adenosylcobinamide kinase/adenosylcobinamide-phosphate guanylyltransferase